ncbi:hypothetical protein BpHYR1_000125 [Brachionus plicatilis]|uniref:Uncharacterized protein n=1 Tax=Brachionus plicatilis TaxID=10195 RepID=A0A3M7S8K5_BRAPC|nr:hypothetical protein BpHYR1_000125 [Brachionus plicatilis]
MYSLSISISSSSDSNTDLSFCSTRLASTRTSSTISLWLIYYCVNVIIFFKKTGYKRNPFLNNSGINPNWGIKALLSISEKEACYCVTLTSNKGDQPNHLCRLCLGEKQICMAALNFLMEK